jgi:SAM-dependent methyltransferase
VAGLALRACPVCSRPVWTFKPLPRPYFEEWSRSGFPYRPRDFETLNAREYECPHCHASDRDRLYALWINRRTGGGSLLDVGPSVPLQALLRGRFEYVSLDSAAGADEQGDVQSLAYADGTFDAILCSHVLEHVPDDRRALAELRRVLRSGGWGIVMVPICLAARETEEDASVAEAEAWRRFGQGDHVRLYDRAGFRERLATAGFRITEWSPGMLDRLRYGLARGSVLYAVS